MGPIKSLLVLFLRLLTKMEAVLDTSITNIHMPWRTVPSPIVIFAIANTKLEDSCDHHG